MGKRGVAEDRTNRGSLPLLTRKDAAVVLLLVALLPAMYAVSRTPAGCQDFHVRAALTGDSDLVNRFLAQSCDAVDSRDARAALAVDTVFAVAYGAILWLAIRRWWSRAWRTTALKRLHVVVYAPIVAAALDVAENAVLAWSLDDVDGNLRVSSFAATAAAVLGWWKWAFAAVAVAAAVLSLLGTFGYRHTPVTGCPPRADATPPTPDGTGICLSGGGIRSASHSIGFLRTLDDAGLFRRARFLSAVSGGAYAAVAWFVARETKASACTVKPKPTGEVDGLLLNDDPNTSLVGYIREHRRYLANGRGGIVSAAATVVAYLTVHLLVIALAVYVAAWPVGQLAASPVVVDALSSCTYEGCTRPVDVGWRHVAAGLVPLLVAAAAVAASAFLAGNTHRTALRLAGGFAAAGAVMLLTLAGIPFAIANAPEAFAQLPGWLPRGSDTANGAGLLGVLSALGVTGALLRLLAKPVSRSAPRLGGALLAIGLLVLGGFFATQSAYGRGLLADWRAFAVAFAALCVLYFLLDQRWFSLHRLYLIRLRSTFSTEQRTVDGQRHVVGRHRDNEGTWNEYADRQPNNQTLPEVLVCCAAQRSGPAVTGVPAVSFVFSSTDVRMYAVTNDGNGSLRVAHHIAPSASYVQSTPSRTLAKPSAAAAMSGAAFTSAMGRHSLGSTNALLAALNLRLGVWMPNPSYVNADGRRRFKKPRLSYLVKEMIGSYDLDEPYVYVTDGGHWENLGLVELVRRRCAVIICCDASGDEPGLFGTLEEAITLARIEADATININLDRLEPDNATGMSRDCVAVGVVRYHAASGHTAATDCDAAGCCDGLLFYGKSLVSPYAPQAVQAFALQDPLFPRYPTYDQFLNEEEFDRMVELGQSVAERAVHLHHVFNDAVSSQNPSRLGDEEPVLAAAYEALTRVTETEKQ